MKAPKPDEVAERKAAREARKAEEMEFRWWRKHFKPLYPNTTCIKGAAGKHKSAILALMKLDYHQLQFLVKVSKRLLAGERLPAYKPLMSHRKPGPRLVDTEDDT